MAETPDQIKRHIANLTEFEEKYREFLGGMEADHTAQMAEGAVGAPDDLGSDWSSEQFARRKREISGLAARADRAMKSSGVGQYAMLNPPAIGGGMKAGDLPSQVFEFVPMGYGDDGMSFQRSILERVPAQLAGLEMKLEEAEAAEKEAGDRVFGETVLNSMDAEKERRLAREQRPPKQMEPSPSRKRPWHENPWAVAIGSGLVVGVVVLILTLVLTHS